MTAFRLWPSTNGPSAPVDFTPGNAFISGMTFMVTGEAWFQGYWWWVAPNVSSGGHFQATTATKCALWQMDAMGTPHLVPGSVVTSGTLTAGQWNYIPLATPIALSYGGSAGTANRSAVAGVAGPAQYIAAIGCNGPFPDTTNTWGAGQTYPNGLTSGPLTAYSAQAAAMPAPLGSMPQGSFSVAGTDPAANCPTSTSNTDNFWVDVQVSDYSGAPAGTSLRLWPSFPVPDTGVNNDTTTAVSGTAFSLSRPCKLRKIWMFSAANATGFASRIGIFNSDTQAELTAAGNSSPTWLQNGSAASAGSGWVYVDYSAANVTLPAGNYMVAFYNGSGLKIYPDTHNYFFSGTDPVGGASVGGPGWNGLSWGGGILTAPNVAKGPLLVYDDSSGTKRGQTAYQPGPSSWAYPGEFEASSDWGETRWADVEVTPLVLASGIVPLLAAAGRL